MRSRLKMLSRSCTTRTWVVCASLLNGASAAAATTPRRLTTRPSVIRTLSASTATNTATSRATAAAEDAHGLGLAIAAEDPGQANVELSGVSAVSVLSEVATEVVIATPVRALALLLVIAAEEATTTVAEIPVTTVVPKDATARAVLLSRTGATPRTTDLTPTAGVNHHTRLAVLKVSLLGLTIHQALVKTHALVIFPVTALKPTTRMTRDVTNVKPTTISTSLPTTKSEPPQKPC